MNKVILIGHVGKDADCMPVASTDVSKFTLATSERYMDKHGQKVTNTEWHNITCWGSLAKLAYKYIKKGSQIAVEGKLHYGSYEKDGIKRYTTEIVASEIKFVGLKSGESSPADPAPSAAQSTPQAAAQDAFGGSVEDDLPF